MRRLRGLVLCLEVAAFAFATGQTAIGNANPPGCFVGTSISLSVFADSNATVNLIGQVLTPGQTVYYRATLSQAGSQCGFQGGTITIVAPSGISNNATPGGGIPLVCGSGTCSPTGVSNVNSIVIAYVVQASDRGVQRGPFPCFGNPSNQVQGVAIYSGGLSHCDAGDSCDPSAQVTLCNPIPTGTNSWTDGNGKWETSTNWSRALAPSTNDIINLITNTGSHTVTIDATTTNSPSTLTIHNLTIITNTLRLTNARTNNPLRVRGALTLGNLGSILITNSALQVDGGPFVRNDGVITLDSGSFNAGTNEVRLATGAPAQGALIVNGGFASMGTLTLSTAGGSSGFAALNGGTLSVDHYIQVGAAGSGTLTVSNGNLLAGQINIAVANSIPGTFTTAGGSVHLGSLFGGVGNGFSTGQVWVTGGSLTMDSNLVLGSPGVGILTVSNGTVRTANLLLGNNAGSQGTLRLVGGTVTVYNYFGLGNLVGANPAVALLSGGALYVTNATSTGLLGLYNGTLVLSNGATLVADVFTNVGATFNFVAGIFNLTGPATVDRGTATFSGGFTVLSSNLVVGITAGSTGTVNVTGGTLVATNGTTTIGTSGGAGGLIVSNASVVTKGTSIGTGTNSTGWLMLEPGSSMGVLSNLTVGSGSGSTGRVALAGGLLVDTNGPVIIGRAGGVGSVTLATNASVSVSAFKFADGVVPQVAGGGGSVLRLNTMTLSTDAGSQGSLTVSDGCTNEIYVSLIVGDCSVGAFGDVTISGGTLLITNAAHTATLDVRAGIVSFSRGVVQIDKLVMTNGCGLFVHNGGTLSIISTNLPGNLDADGDGISNSYELSHGLDPFNDADGNVDSDGDGLSNLREFLAGTDATNHASVFRITSVVRTNSDVRVTWTMGSGRTNALQAASGASYNANNFAAIFTVTNTVGSVTNYVDVGGATNVPSRYYRVKIVP